MKQLTNNDWFRVSDIENDDQLQLLAAIYSANGFDIGEQSEFPLCYYNGSYSIKPPSGNCEKLKRFFSLSGRREETPALSPQDVFFHGAPEWATCVVKGYEGNFAWAENFEQGVPFRIKYINRSFAGQELNVSANHGWKPSDIVVTHEPAKWMPEVGVRCQATWGVKTKWYKAYLLADGYVLVRKGGWRLYNIDIYKADKAFEFKPIETERDEFVKAYENFSNKHDAADAKDWGGQIYDALKSGKLKAPEVE